MVKDLRISGVELATRGMRLELDAQKKINADLHHQLVQMRERAEAYRLELVAADAHLTAVKESHHRALTHTKELASAYRHYAGCWLALESLVKDRNWQKEMLIAGVVEAQRMNNVANYGQGIT